MEDKAFKEKSLVDSSDAGVARLGGDPPGRIGATRRPVHKGSRFCEAEAASTAGLDGSTYVVQISGRRLQKQGT